MFYVRVATTQTILVAGLSFDVHGQGGILNRPKRSYLLELISDSEQLNIIPDYTKNYEQVCEECTGAMIKLYGPDVLSFCPLVTARSNHHRILPSWVPDWSKKMYCVLGDRIDMRPYNACTYAEQDSGISMGRLRPSGARLSEIVHAQAVIFPLIHSNQKD